MTKYEPPINSKFASGMEKSHGLKVCAVSVLLRQLFELKMILQQPPSGSGELSNLHHLVRQEASDCLGYLWRRTLELCQSPGDHRSFADRFTSLQA